MAARHQCDPGGEGFGRRSVKRRIGGHRRAEFLQSEFGSDYATKKHFALSSWVKGFPWREGGQGPRQTYFFVF